MKKYLAVILGLGMMAPAQCWALEGSDLAVELGDDFDVQVGEKFNISVLSAYDKTESCAQFFYDWRQTKGPITASPLNNDVLAPEFQINTTGEYTFSLAIETRCDGMDNIRSESDKITITVLENETQDETEKNYTEEILPGEIRLDADGESSWDLNFYLEDESGRVDGEKIEFSLSSEDEVLAENLGKLEAIQAMTENGMIALKYTAPLIEQDWVGGTVELLAKSAYGSAVAQIRLEPVQEENYQTELKVVQTVEGLPYLIQNQNALGLLNVKLNGTDETEIGVMDVWLNDAKIYHEEKIFFKDWSEAQKENLEHLASFYFVPEDEENVLKVELQIGSEVISLEQEFGAYDADNINLDIQALAEGSWADQAQIDLSKTLAPMLNFLSERAMTDVASNYSLKEIPVIGADEITEEVYLVVPEGYDGEILTERNLHADGNKYELAQIYFQDNGDKISAPGVWIKTEKDSILDKGFEVIDAETPSLFSENEGAGLPYDTAWSALAKLRIIGSYADLQRSHWSYEYMRELIGRGIIGGYADMTVRPDQEITRAEFLKILLSSGQIEVDQVQGNVNFSDMSAVDWSMPYIEKAVRYGLVRGYADGSFAPNKSITRAEAVKILAEYLDLDLPEEQTESTFSDVEMNAWYAPYVEAVREIGIVSGYADGTFQPGKSITRAEASKIIQVAIFGQ